MEIKHFSHRMIELMPRLMRSCAASEHNSLSRGEITLPQLWSLEYLARNGNCAMNELAREFRISRPAATGLINRLIAQGMVKRHHDEKDRRIVRVEITAKGRRVVNEIYEQKRQQFVNLFGRLSVTDRVQYLAILERVIAVLDQQEKRA